MNKQERADFREIVEPVLLNSGFMLNTFLRMFGFGGR